MLRLLVYLFCLQFALVWLRAWLDLQSGCLQWPQGRIGDTGRRLRHCMFHHSWKDHCTKCSMPTPLFVCSCDGETCWQNIRCICCVWMSNQFHLQLCGKKLGSRCRLRKHQWRCVAKIDCAHSNGMTKCTLRSVDDLIGRTSEWLVRRWQWEAKLNGSTIAPFQKPDANLRWSHLAMNTWRVLLSRKQWIKGRRSSRVQTLMSNFFKATEAFKTWTTSSKGFGASTAGINR